MSEVVDAPVADARSPLPPPAGTLEALRAASVRKAEGSLEWEEIREATRDAFDRARGRGEA